MHVEEFWFWSEFFGFFFFKVCCVCSFLDNEPLTYSGGYMFPGWAYHLGRATSLSSILTVFVWAAIKLCLAEGTFRQARAQAVCHPNEQCHNFILHSACLTTFFPLTLLYSASGGPLVSRLWLQRKRRSCCWTWIGNDSNVTLSPQYCGSSVKCKRHKRRGRQSSHFMRQCVKCT